MTYFYSISYDEKDDSFYARVDDGTTAGPVIFEIDDTDEMCYYILEGKMKHIDDTEGLEAHLKEMTLLQSHDVLMLCEKMIW